MVHHKKVRIRGASPRKKRKHKKSRRNVVRQNSIMSKKAESMSLDTDITKFRIAVIESLPDGESKTGAKLYEGELIPLTLKDKSLTASLHEVKDLVEFKRTIDEIADSLSGDELVTLHIEAHGAGENGIRLASGVNLGWKDFMDECRKLNDMLSGLLVVILSMCYSIPILGSIDPTQRAPFKAILLTNKDVTVDEVERGFTAFYNSYKNPLDVFKATGVIRDEVNKGDETSSPFHLMVADHIFDLLTNPDRDPDGFVHIVNDTFCRLKAQYPEYTRERTEKEIREMLNDLAKNGRDYFLFFDRVKGAQIVDNNDARRAMAGKI